MWSAIELCGLWLVNVLQVLCFCIPIDSSFLILFPMNWLNIKTEAFDFIEWSYINPVEHDKGLVAENQGYSCRIVACNWPRNSDD